MARERKLLVTRNDKNDSGLFDTAVDSDRAGAKHLYYSLRLFCCTMVKFVFRSLFENLRKSEG